MTKQSDPGLSGENLAASYLSAGGYEILARRWRFGHKEIDLVVRRGDTVVFVEVKQRANENFAPIRTSVSVAKRRNLVEAAQGWINQHGNKQENLRYRFDVVLVLESDGNRKLSVEHIEDAFRA